MTMLADNADPRPQPPERPLPAECCESGCEVCVYDVYADQLEAYERALAAWEARHPEAESPLHPVDRIE